MPLDNRAIARHLEQLADLLEIEAANPFRVRAYRNAARTVAEHGKSMASLLADGVDLSTLPGIGDAIAAKIVTLVETGELPQLEAEKEKVPAALADLMHVRGLGPKRVQALYQALGIRSVTDLEHALADGRVEALPGFGAKTVDVIRAGMAAVTAAQDRMRLADAERIADGLVSYLKGITGVGEVTVAGSLRRRRETVGDLDILVTCRSGAPVMQRFTGHEDVARVVSSGETRSTVLLRSGVQVDLRVVPKKSFGAALQYFTGSKAHNVALRGQASRKNLKLNEYGLFRGEKSIAGASEAQVYKALGLDYIEPELREDQGELEAARKGRLPKLVSVKDNRGDLHCHTDASDGRLDLEALAKAGKARGHEYLAVTDHTLKVRIANGLDPKRLRSQMEAIDALNERVQGITLLTGAEVEILDDGRLDLPDDLLAELDVVVGAMHYGLDQPRPRLMKRLLRAMDNPALNIIAHPTGRLLGEREASAVDMEALMEAARERGCVLEVNAQPARMDLGDMHCRLARDLGVRVAISSDSHRESDLDLIRFGVDQARRGWLGPEQVINTRSLSGLRRLLRRS